MRLPACLIATAMMLATLPLAWPATPEPPPAPEPPPTAEQFAKGSNLFGQICSHCHGLQMVNPGNASFDLRKFPHDDRNRFFNSVRNGKKAMPPWKDVLHPDEIEAVWAYVRNGGVAPN